MMLSAQTGADLGPLAWWLALSAGAGYALAIAPAARRPAAVAAAVPPAASRRDRMGAWLLVAAAVAHAALLLLDILGQGRARPGARWGFGPMLSLTMWLVLLVHLVESRLHPSAMARSALGAAGIAAVLLAVLFPGESHVAANAWAPWHWLLGVASYGLFGAAVLHAWMLGRAERSMRAGAASAEMASTGLPLLGLERLTFRFVEAGMVALTLAIVAGLASGPTRAWTHKTVFTLLSWGVFATLLAGRRLRGWRGRRATRWLYGGAALLLLGYAGSRFVFEVLLGRSSVS